MQEQLNALLKHQLALSTASANGHTPEGAAELQRLKDKTPKVVMRFLTARAEAVYAEYLLAAEQLRARYLKLVIINSQLRTISRGAVELRSRDWQRMCIPAFKIQSGHPLAARAGTIAIDWDSIDTSGAMEDAAAKEVAEMQRLGVDTSLLRALL